MALLPSIPSSNIADCLSKPLPTITHQRIVSLIGADPTFDTLASATTTSVDPSATVAPTTTLLSDSVPTAPTLPIVLDTGASFSRTPFASDFALEITQAPYGLIRSAFDTSVASDPVASNSTAFSKVSSTDPYTLITGEDIAISVDLSFPDSDSVASTLVYSSFRQFGTATLVFLSDANSKLITILVEPTQVDWLHWIPLPRLTPTESYFHIFGRDYLQAFALLHLIPIWIYYLVHSVVNLEE